MLSEGGVKTCTQRDAAGRRKGRWAKSCRGFLQGRRTSGRTHHHHHHYRRHHPYHPPHHQRLGGGVGGCGGAVTSLRPVNVKGNRARGMQAPKNTNQFLMHEKYQMLHMRSDSVGSDSGSGSDSDSELTDMDSYLGVLENARGALLDSPDPHGPPSQVLLLQEERVCLQEDSLQYFPSEDDLLQSQNFMQRDFVEFCDILTP
ncbi:hypothetical protein LDENG_00242850 [Lucifuga dentata]|nr:hypothetical protein LDENG_00242850 [Lucifuga dentata]